MFGVAEHLPAGRQLEEFRGAMVELSVAGRDEHLAAVEGPARVETGFGREA